MKIHIVNVKENFPYDFYLGRKNKTFNLQASPLANPFTIKKESERDARIEDYALWLDERLADPMSDEYDTITDITEHLLNHGEVTLSCFCAPKRCHCEVVATAIQHRISYCFQDDPRASEIDVSYQSNKTLKKTLYKIKQNPLMESWRETWNQETCKGCEKCDLHKSRTHSVWIRGNGEQRILIIGEAPGEEEDRLALPFVGDSGKMLEVMLNSVGLQSQRDTWIVNACKCRPEENRTPTAKEVDACFPYLQTQITQLMPKIILALGGTSTRRLIGKSDFKISNCRGKTYPLDLTKWNFTSEDSQESVLRFSKILVLPTFHPAYLLRNPKKEVASVKWYAWQDMVTLRGLLATEDVLEPDKP